jgi:hypothetical protein
VALLGEGGAIQDEGRVVIAQLLADVAAQLFEDGLVNPLAGTDEQLQGAALETGVVGDGFGGLALQAGELALEDGLGMTSLFVTVEAGEVAADEALQVGHTGGFGPLLANCRRGRRPVGSGHQNRAIAAPFSLQDLQLTGDQRGVFGMGLPYVRGSGTLPRHPERPAFSDGPGG